MQEHKVLLEFGIEILTTVFNIYNGRYFPSDVTKYVLLAITKRPRAIQCEKFQAIDGVNLYPVL